MRRTYYSKEMQYLKERCIKAILKNQQLGDQLKAQQVAKLDKDIEAQKALRQDLMDSQAGKQSNRTLCTCHALCTVNLARVHQPSYCLAVVDR